jgi:hypothetical protein
MRRSRRSSDARPGPERVTSMAAVYSDDSPKGHHSQARTQKNDGPGIGELLRGAREHLGLTLEQVAGEQRFPGDISRGSITAHLRHFRRSINAPRFNLRPRGQPRSGSGAGALRARAGAVSRPRSISEAADTSYASFFPQRALIASAFLLAATCSQRHAAGPVARRSDGRRGCRLDQADGGAGKPAMHAAVGSDRRELDRNPQPPARPSQCCAAASSHRCSTCRRGEGDIPITTQPGDERPSAELVTELIVTTEPRRARDGGRHRMGCHPATIRYLAPGDKRIRVSKEGYASTELVVSVAEGRRQNGRIRLRNLPRPSNEASPPNRRVAPRGRRANLRY